MSNPRRKEKCSRAHARTEKRKDTRRRTADAQASGNKIMIKAGELTPWEAAKAKRRKARRVKVEAYAKAQGKGPGGQS
jgi:hypothetical protein